MRRRTRALARIARLSLTLDRRAAVLVLVLVVVSTTSTAIIAVTQRALVDNAADGIVVGVVLAAVAGAAGFLIDSAVRRIHLNLRFTITRLVERQLEIRLHRAASRTPLIDDLDNPQYLDDIELLRRNSMTLADSFWRVVSTVSVVGMVVLSSALLFLVHPAFALLVLSAVPLVTLTAFSGGSYRKWTKRASAADREENDWHRLFVDPDTAFELKVTGAGRYASERASASWRRGTALAERAGWITVLWSAIGWLIFAGALLAILVQTTVLIRAGEASAGDIVLVLSLAGRIREQVAGVTGAFRDMSVISPTLEAFSRHLELPGPVGGRELPDRLTSGVVLRDVTYRYPGSSVEGLRGVSATLPAGAAIGVVGPNGAGKSTLTKVLLGLIHPSDGEVLVDGDPLAEYDRPAWNRRAGGVFQDFVKPMFTAREVVAWGDIAQIDDQERLHAAARLGRADALIAGLPASWETALGRSLGGHDLSQGQWQRLAIARGFMADAPLLFVVDEPAADLDPQAEHDIFENVRGWGSRAAAETGCITVLVTHRFSTVRAADLILVMDAGRIVESGTHEELMRLGGSYRRNYEIQEEEYR